MSEEKEQETRIGLSFRKEIFANQVIVHPITTDGVPISGVIACEVTSEVDEMATMTLKVYVEKTLAEQAAERMTK